MGRVRTQQFWSILVVPLLLAAALAQLAAPSIGSWHELTAHRQIERDGCERRHDRNFSHTRSEHGGHRDAHECVLCRGLSQLGAKWVAPAAAVAPGTDETAALPDAAPARPANLLALLSASPRAPPRA